MTPPCKSLRWYEEPTCSNRPPDKFFSVEHSVFRYHSITTALSCATNPACAWPNETMRSAFGSSAVVERLQPKCSCVERNFIHLFASRTFPGQYPPLPSSKLPEINMDAIKTKIDAANTSTCVPVRKGVNQAITPAVSAIALVNLRTILLTTTCPITRVSVCTHQSPRENDPSRQAAGNTVSRVVASTVRRREYESSSAAIAKFLSRCASAAER